MDSTAARCDRETGGLLVIPLGTRCHVESPEVVDADSVLRWPSAQPQRELIDAEQPPLAPVGARELPRARRLLIEREAHDGVDGPFVTGESIAEHVAGA